MSVQLNKTLTRHNIHEQEANYHLSLELGAESLHYFLLVPVGCGLQIKREYQLTPEEYEEALLKIYGLASERKIYIRPVCAPHYFRILAQKKSKPVPLPKVPGSLSTRAGEPGTFGSGTARELNQMTKGCLAGT